ncbi:hypothetical protein [Sedimenticola selenatireducens]|uniref:hypothetical protein n=1 Tax=Sedimenticola selenatireducens TaxID=191960 RepID=UPI0004B40FBE|nr:hypothetical protein [Sedimenticola selenatireducens]
MSGAAGYVLLLTSERLEALEDNRYWNNSFAEPVDEFSHCRSLPLICFIGDSEGKTKYIGVGRRGVRAGTDLRRLNVYDLQEFEPSIDLFPFIEQVSPQLKWRLRSTIKNGGYVTQKQFAALIDAILATDHALGQLFKKYSSERENRIRSLPDRSKRQLAFQKETLSTALACAKIDRSSLQEWEPPEEGGDQPSSFLDGLPQSRLREDQMVVNDMNNVPGFSRVRDMVQGAAIFEGVDRTRLTVILANRLPLEQLTGADLIYFNETFKSFVFVQYKAMEPGSAGSEPIYRLPDQQLEDEILRMDKIAKQLAGTQEPNTPDEYRLDSAPFYLKLCSRIVFNPDSTSLVSGMYIPLTHWKLLESDKGLVGERGGRGVTFRNIKRHITNSQFIDLVSNAWIGTTPCESEILEVLVKHTIQEGRAVMVAVKL